MVSGDRVLLLGLTLERLLMSQRGFKVTLVRMMPFGEQTQAVTEMPCNRNHRITENAVPVYLDLSLILTVGVTGLPFVCFVGQAYFGIVWQPWHPTLAWEKC